MPTLTINGVSLFYEIGDSSDIPLVFVHGAWASHHTWDDLVPHLSNSFQILRYDRRGHSQSERPSEQVTVQDHVHDLAALIEHFDLAPAWVIGNSFGASITYRLAGDYPELLQGISGHEAPLLSIVKDEPQYADLAAKTEKIDATVAHLIASGDNAEAAQEFMDSVIPGYWERVPQSYRQQLISNAPAYLDQVRDPESYAFDPTWLDSFPGPQLHTVGQNSDPLTTAISAKLADLLPDQKILEIPGADHVPQRTNPQEYAELITTFVSQHQ